MRADTDGRRGPRRRVGLLAALCALALAVGCGGAAPGEPEPETAAAPAAMAARSGSLGDGFVVWESNRGGAWRIWTKRLDGTGLRRLTPDEPGRDHCCPHISPDGRRVAYLSSPKGRPDYPKPGTRGALHLVSVADGETRLLADSALSYFENRAVVWVDAERLIHIDGSSATVEIDLATGEARRRIAGREGERGWLLNATADHATNGQPTFSPFDALRGTVAQRGTLGGCQPYFSHDGRWGYWTAGAGGPLNRIDLATRKISTMLEKNDPRMVDDWGYAYFPMLSVDGRLFAYAASRNQHDHFKSDYEVFVVETDPVTLEPLGQAVRITEHGATDRYPDVYLAPLALGRQRGEAPLTVRLEPGRETGDWAWDFGDGATGEGAVGGHTYTVPGRYEVVATRGSDRLRGQVVVAEAAPPKAERAELVEEGRIVLVHFDEPVDLAATEATLESGHPVASWSARGDRTLAIELARPLRRPDRVELTGVVDRAQVPNPLARGLVEIDPPIWPSRREGLVFLWETGLAANLVPDPEQGAERASTLVATGSGRLDGNGVMVLDGGAFHAEPREQSGILRRALQRRNNVSLEVTLTPEPAPTTGPRSSRRRPPSRVVSFASGRRGQNFRLLQRGTELVFSIRVGGDENPHVRLFDLPPGRPSHVVVTFTTGRLAAYLDGELVVETDEVVGDFFHWRDYPFVLGDEWGGGMPWRGRLEGLAVYDRPLGPQEVRENYLRYRSRLAQRQVVEPARIVARLVRRSRVPGLQEISPYREALGLYEYELVETLEGPAPGPGGARVRVAHWLLMDGEEVAAGRAEVGATYRFDVEPFAANPQVHSLYLSDDLGGGGGAPALFAPDPAPEMVDGRR